MSHFILSMMLLDAAFALAWCSRYEPWERRRSRDRLGVWAVRALIPLGQLTILAGTIATASGPHAGAHEGQLVHRFDFEGTGTLEWVVQRHAAIATIYGPRTDRRLAAPAPPRGRQTRPAAADPRHWPPGSTGRHRRPAVVAGTSGGHRLGPRRDRDRQLAGDALDRGGGGAAGAPWRARAESLRRGQAARRGRRGTRLRVAPLLALDRRPQPGPGTPRRASEGALDDHSAPAAQQLVGAGAAALDRRRHLGRLRWNRPVPDSSPTWR